VPSVVETWAGDGPGISTPLAALAGSITEDDVAGSITEPVGDGP
jgi:hypothetical protein